jgi:hypothetical protein
MSVAQPHNEMPRREWLLESGADVVYAAALQLAGLSLSWYGWWRRACSTPGWRRT